MRNEAMIGEKWPYVGIDDRTVADCTRCLELAAGAGYNEFDVFGLFASYAWPVDIRSAVDPERARRVRSILDVAHALDIRVLCGLGVYSWGFDRIIEERPEVRGTNPRAMCGSQAASWDWMARVIDFILSEFEIDGFHLESSDQGRCACSACASLGNVEYHSQLNARVADYVHDQSPGTTIMMNMCGYVPWGETLSADDQSHLADLSNHIDCLIDPGHVGRGFIDVSSRADFIKSLRCDFGTSGGVWVYPPQRWERDRWFLPHTRASGWHLRELYEDGGRALDCYMGPVLNPGVEMNIAFCGHLVNDVDRSDEDVLTEIVDDLFKPQSSKVNTEIVALFQQAERAYYDTYHPFPPRTRESPGELHLAPLFGSEPGAPIYLAGTRPDDQPLESAGLGAYKSEIEALLERVVALDGLADDGGRTQRIGTCLQNVLTDIRSL